jgi:CRP-like cAMP-binding protein
MISVEDQLRINKAWKPYKSYWQSLSVPAKTVLLKEGSYANQLFKIKKGSLRVWFNHDGKEISFQFFFEGDVVCSVESFRKHVPSMFNIETIEPCELVWISKKDLDKAVDESPFLNKYMMDWAVDRQSDFIRHFFSFLKDMPQQRYENLLRGKPEIIKRIPLQYIASYLGITPVSLSRIRNKI